MMQDFLIEDHPISGNEDHRSEGITGAAGDDVYSPFLQVSSFLAFTPR